MFLDGMTILITGGTGSFGRKTVEVLRRDYHPRKIIIYSRDEMKQFEMRQLFPQENIRWFLGDVRDQDRLHRAFWNVDYVVHAAALKQVPAAEYNPFEAIKTNVLGAQNVIEAAIDNGVRRVIALSTDKAANPINLYGATKLCSDKLFVAGNALAGGRNTRFAVVRYGNVVASRGSVIPFFLKERHKGSLPITDMRMTRFWITLDQGVRFVLRSMERMAGGELFVPKLPSMRIIDLAQAVAPECELRCIGIRPGEKVHEILIPEDDARHAVEFDDHYVVYPEGGWYQGDLTGGRPLPEGFVYSSGQNERWVKQEDLVAMVNDTVDGK
jgi:UDP-N-acetylglucosamine 4,6-dehydratase